MGQKSDGADPSKSIGGEPAAISLGQGRGISSDPGCLQTQSYESFYEFDGARDAIEDRQPMTG
jgi:hypothetical protein